MRTTWLLNVPHCVEGCASVQPSIRASAWSRSQLFTNRKKNTIAIISDFDRDHLTLLFTEGKFTSEIYFSKFLLDTILFLLGRLMPDGREEFEGVAGLGPGPILKLPEVFHAWITLEYIYWNLYFSLSLSLFLFLPSLSTTNQSTNLPT